MAAFFASPLTSRVNSGWVAADAVARSVGVAQCAKRVTCCWAMSRYAPISLVENSCPMSVAAICKSTIGHVSCLACPEGTRPSDQSDLARRLRPRATKARPAMMTSAPPAAPSDNSGTEVGPFDGVGLDGNTPIAYAGPEISSADMRHDAVAVSSRCIAWLTCLPLKDAAL